MFPGKDGVTDRDTVPVDTHWSTPLLIYIDPRGPKRLLHLANLWTKHSIFQLEMPLIRSFQTWGIQVTAHQPMPQAHAFAAGLDTPLPRSVQWKWAKTLGPIN